MKKILNLYRYISLLKKNKDELYRSRVNGNNSGIRFDWLYRLYTVLNLPFEDSENIKRYGISYIDEMVKIHISKMNNYLLKLGILEYVRLDTENIIQIDDFNVKIVMRFQEINLRKWFKFLLFFIPILIIVALFLVPLFFI